MTAIAKNYDVICFQLRHNLYAQLQTPLKTNLNTLCQTIKAQLVPGQHIDVQNQNVLSQIFNVKFAAIKWLSTQAAFNYAQAAQNMVPQIETLEANKKTSHLAQNIQFALRCNQRVVNAIGNAQIANFVSTATEIETITYSQFIAAMAMANMGQHDTQNSIDFLHATLIIEYVILATDIITTENLPVSTKNLNELAFLIANAAQNYIALATAMGILAPKGKPQNRANMVFDAGFITEQKELANAGLYDFALNQ